MALLSTGNGGGRRLSAHLGIRGGRLEVLGFAGAREFVLIFPIFLKEK